MKRHLYTTVIAALLTALAFATVASARTVVRPEQFIIEPACPGATWTQSLTWRDDVRFSYDGCVRPYCTDDLSVERYPTSEDEDGATLRMRIEAHGSNRPQIDTVYWSWFIVDPYLASDGGVWEGGPTTVWSHEGRASGLEARRRYRATFEYYARIVVRYHHHLEYWWCIGRAVRDLPPRGERPAKAAP